MGEDVGLGTFLSAEEEEAAESSSEDDGSAQSAARATDRAGDTAGSTCWARLRVHHGRRIGSADAENLAGSGASTAKNLLDAQENPSQGAG